MIIAIAAKPRHGKDTLCNLLIEEFKKRNINACRNSLAGDLIKLHLKDFFLCQNIDVFSEDHKIKELIRPILKETGIFLRKNTNNRYFVDRFIEKENGINIITDLRFYDELEWLHKEKNGLAIHLNRFDGPNDILEENDIEFLENYCDINFHWSSLKYEPKIGIRVANLVDQILTTKPN